MEWGTTAVKNVLSLTSESTVMASDLVSPCSRKEPSKKTRSIQQPPPAPRNEKERREGEGGELTSSRDGDMVAGGGGRRRFRSRG